MDKEKFQAVIDYFSDLKEPLSMDIQNAIEDVFLENEDIDKVICYYKEDVSDFEKALTFKNNVELYLDGKNKGITNNIYTYYGGVSYSLSEKINLFKSTNEVEEQISELVNTETSKIDDDTVWSVILHELVEWDTSSSQECKRTLTLHIYCPYSEYGDIDDADVEFAKIYEQMRGEK